MDPVKAAVEGRGLGVRLNGKSYFLSGEEAIAIHNGLIDQMNEDGTARSAPIRFRTANGEVEIVEEDARQYVEIVGRLARTPAFKLIAG